MMNYLNIKIYLLFLCIVLLSCKTECSSFYVFYQGSLYNQDVDLLLRPDSTYVYSKTDYSLGWEYKEIGKYTNYKDSIFLYPLFEINNDTCSLYINKAWYTTVKNDSVIAKEISKRIYLKGNEIIKDVSLDYYYPDDKKANSFYEEFSLYKIKLNKTKDEDLVMKSRRLIDRIW